MLTCNCAINGTGIGIIGEFSDKFCLHVCILPYKLHTDSLLLSFQILTVL